MKAVPGIVVVFDFDTKIQDCFQKEWKHVKSLCQLVESLAGHPEAIPGVGLAYDAASSIRKQVSRFKFCRCIHGVCAY